MRKDNMNDSDPSRPRLNQANIVYICSIKPQTQPGLAVGVVAYVDVDTQPGQLMLFPSLLSPHRLNPAMEIFKDYIYSIMIRY